MLANRLKEVLKGLISKSQKAEVRQILNVAFIANEAIDSLVTKKEKGLLYKLQLEKT